MDTIISITDFNSREKSFRITALVLHLAEIRNCLLGRGYCRRNWKCRSEVVKKCLERIEVQSNFGLYEDSSGVLRCKGRIANADVSLETKVPALLLKNHYLSIMLVDAHERVHHTRVEATVAQLRTIFWIGKGRQFVKRTLASCSVCRRYEGKSYSVPPQIDLPEFRLSQKPAFTYVGEDYAGPLYINASG